MDLRPDCDQVALRHECDLGFATSCYPLSMHDESWKLFKRRTAQLANAGCRAGVLNECELLVRVGVRSDDEIYALQRLCEALPYHDACKMLEQHHIDLNQRDKAREIAEHTCQNSWRWDCLPLAESYLDGKYPEPVPHRGRDLLEYGCARPKPPHVRYDPHRVCERRGMGSSVRPP